MSNEQHEVTVYDRAPATAPVSVAQVEAYLRRTGWSKLPDPDEWWWSRGSLAVQVCPSYIDGDEIEAIARAEQRQPSAVLADIAREPAP